MAQVVNNENMVEFVTTGKVAEFVAPDSKVQATVEAKADDAKPDDKAQIKAEVKADALQTRNEDGTFSIKAEPTAVESDAPDADLPERVKKQIGKKHRQMMEAQEFARERDLEAATEKARADTLDRELQRLRGEKSKGPDSPSSESGDPDEPKAEDFKTVGDYTRALTKYEVSKAAKAARAEGETLSQQQKQQAEANALIKSFADRQAEFIKQNPGYEELLNDSDLDVPKMALQYIVESEMGPALAVHLAKNPSEAERLSTLTPARMLAELGKMEARIEAAAEPAKSGAAAVVKQVSRAPAPTQALSSDAATVTHKDPSQMSFTELRAFRQAERESGKRA